MRTAILFFLETLLIIKDDSALGSMIPPLYQWPFCNLTMAYDIRTDTDADRPQKDECWELVEGPDLGGISFDVFQFQNGGHGYADLPLHRSRTFSDFSVVMYISPSQLNGVILEYFADNMQAGSIASFSIEMYHGRVTAVFMDSGGITLSSGKSASACTPNVWSLVVIAYQMNPLQIQVRVDAGSHTMTQATSTVAPSCEGDCSTSGSDSDDDGGDDDDVEVEESDTDDSDGSDDGTGDDSDAIPDHAGTASPLDAQGRFYVSHSSNVSKYPYAGKFCCLAFFDDIIDPAESLENVLADYTDLGSLIGALSVRESCGGNSSTTISTSVAPTTSTTTLRAPPALDSGMTSPIYPLTQLWPLSQATAGYGMVGPLRPSAPEDFMCLRAKHVCQLSDTGSTYLDGSQFSYLQYQVNDLILDGELTITFYLRPDPPGEGTLFDFRASSVKSSGVKSLTLEMRAGSLYLIVEDENGVCNTVYSIPLVPCEWSRVLIYRPTTQTDKIFIDNASTFRTGSCASHSTGPNGTGSLTFGRQTDVTQTPVGFHGSIACLAIFPDIVGRADVNTVLLEQCTGLAVGFDSGENFTQCVTVPIMQKRKFEMVTQNGRPDTDQPHFNTSTVRSLLECSYQCMRSSTPCRSFAFKSNAESDQCLFYDFVTKTGLTVDTSVDYYEIIITD